MSTEAHLNSAKRHQRMCNQTKGAENLGTAIDVPIKKLEEMQQATRICKDNRDAAYDSTVLSDGALDDAVRNIADSAKQYDRNNPGRLVFPLLFPDGKITTITRASFMQEPDKAEQLLQRINVFEEGHPLRMHAAPLTEAIGKMREAISVYQKSITDEKTAIANEELAQAELRKQYEFNFLDAVKLFGKTFANRLFPKSQVRKKEVVTISSVLD
jgi:hypothetical protein